MSALSFAQLEALWIAAGGEVDYAPTMAAVAYGESGGVPDNTQQGQPAATTGRGLWQITPGTSEPQVGTNAQLNDPLVNARAAVAKFNSAKAAGENPMQPWGGGTSDPIGQISINQGGPLSLATAEALAHSVHGQTIDYTNAIDPNNMTTGQITTWVDSQLMSLVPSLNWTNPPNPGVTNGLSDYLNALGIGGPAQPLTGLLGGTGSGAAHTFVQSIESVPQFLGDVTNPRYWKTAGEYVLAGLLVIFGSILFFKSTATGQRVEGAATSAATAAAV